MTGQVSVFALMRSFFDEECDCPCLIDVLSVSSTWSCLMRCLLFLDNSFIHDELRGGRKTH